jgi:hypothetical protein
MNPPDEGPELDLEDLKKSLPKMPEGSMPMKLMVAFGGEPPKKGAKGKGQGQPFKASASTNDILALAAFVLAAAGALVAVLVAIGLLLGRVDGTTATTIILGCVGGAAIAAVIGAMLKRRK